MIPGNQTYENVVATEKEKTCIIGDIHLARITETCEELNFVIFKCFRGANTKQLDYYVAPMLADETPESITLHIDSNDITKTSYDNVTAEDLAQRIVNTGGKCRSFSVNNIAISSIFIRKNVSINKILIKS